MQLTRVGHLEEIRSGPAPFHHHAALFEGSHRALLDSALPSTRLGAFSFLTGDPRLVFRARRLPGTTRAAITLARRGGATTEMEAELVPALREVLASERVDPASWGARPAPFLSGAIGYFGYEAGRFFDAAMPEARASDTPDVYLLFSDAVLIHGHERGKRWIAASGETVEEARAAAAELRRRVESFEGLPAIAPPRAPASVRFEVDRARYGARVEEARARIFAGDAFEVCLSHRMEADLASDPFALYRALRAASPAPFAAFFEAPEVAIASSSPERFLHLGADGVAEARPIKGTRPRGATAEEDARLRDALATSEKDRAENVMIVDLLRNDLGRVSIPGSVRVPELHTIERYATVHQMVSTITGRLAPGRDALDLIAACFPGGSMTGAPKIEAMKIIDRLETCARGPYAGAIGWLDDAGGLDLSILIRTFVIERGVARFHAGGAVTSDSTAGAEWEETMDKARAMLLALGAAG